MGTLCCVHFGAVIEACLVGLAAQLGHSPPATLSEMRLLPTDSLCTQVQLRKPGGLEAHTLEDPPDVPALCQNSSTPEKVLEHPLARRDIDRLDAVGFLTGELHCLAELGDAIEDLGLAVGRERA